VATRRTLGVHRVGHPSVSVNLSRMARALQSTYRRALERGNLTPRQRRIAGRELRLQRTLEEIDSIAAAGRDPNGALPYVRIARVLPLLLLTAAEHPNRWLHGARMVAHGRRPGVPWKVATRFSVH